MGNEYKVEYIVELLKKGDFSAAKQEFDKVDVAAKKTGESMETFGRQVKSAFLALGGVALLKQSLDAFIESERAVAKLNVALKNRRELSKELSEQLQKEAKALSEVTAFTDEAIINVMSKLLSLGAPRQELGKLTEMVLDLATLLDKDLNRATMAIGQTFRGEFGMLEQVGVDFSKAATGADKFQTAMDQVAKIAGGQAREAMNGISGDAQRTAKALDEAKETLGGWIAAAADWLAKQAQIEATMAAQNSFKPPVPTARFRPKNVSTNGGAPSRGSLLNQPGGPIGPPMATPAAISRADTEAYAAAIFAIDAEEEEAAKQRAEREAKDLAERTKNEMAAHQDKMEALNMERELRAQIAEEGLSGIALEMQRARAAHEERIAQIQQLKFEDVDQYNQLIADENTLYELQQKRIRDAHSGNAQFKRDIKQVGDMARQEIAGGLANAMVSAARGARVEWNKFFADFLAHIAEAILQAIILRVISGAVSYAGGARTGYNGQTYVPATGDAGTYYRPQSRAFEGSAFTPMMVSSNPYSGRMNAQVAKAAAMAGTGSGGSAMPMKGGGGGVAHIIITTDPGQRAEIVSDAVESARVQVAEDMGRNTPIAAATKRLVS